MVQGVNTLEIVVIVVIAVLALLAVGGAVAVRRRLAATKAQFDAVLEQANRDLAEAHAADKGWDPGRLEGAARRVFGDAHPDAQIADIKLVQVVDKPGTDEDAAVFHCAAGDGSIHTVALARRGDDWVADEREGAAVARLAT